MSHQKAFGLAMTAGRKVLATNRSVEGASMRTGPVSGNQSPTAADMEVMPSEGEGSDSDSAQQRQRARSPSFNITSERWRQDHPGYQEIQPRVQRKRSRCCNEGLVNCATQCAHLIDDLQAFKGAKFMRIDQRHKSDSEGRPYDLGGKCVAVKRR